MERIQKVMAEAGVASRRHCEELIREGLVTVNGKLVDALPCFVDAENDRIVVNGRAIRFDKKVYFVLNKPKKVVCSNYDPQGRLCAVDLLKEVKERVYPVGRLDTDSQGLLIMTNDGELANQLTHPRYGVVKTYLVQLNKPINAEDIEKLKHGVHLEQGKASAEKIVVVKKGPKQSLIEVWLREGRNRQIRRMLARLGYPVKQLTRIHIGKISLRGLGVGKYRKLTADEVKHLRAIASMGQKQVADRPIPKKRKKAASVSSAGSKGKGKNAARKSTSGKASKPKAIKPATKKSSASLSSRRIVELD